MKTTAFANEMLALLYQGAAISELAQNAASSPLGSLWMALHTADPGEAGDQTTSEGPFARVAVARSGSGWAVASKGVSPVADVSFANNASGATVTITHVSIGMASGGASKIIHRGTLKNPLVIAVGDNPVIYKQSVIYEDGTIPLIVAPDPTFPSGGISGLTIASIYNVPTGITPVWTPDNGGDAGKIAVGGNGATSKLVIGLTPAAQGSISGTISATGMPSLAITVVVTAPAARLVSAANRSRLSTARATVATAFNYIRYAETPARDLTGLRGIFSNVNMIVGVANGEVGPGNSVRYRAGFVTGISGTGSNQTGAIATPVTFGDAKNGTLITSTYGLTVAAIVKTNRGVNPNTTDTKTYAEFVADGGLIEDSVINGVVVANSKITLPSLYTVVSDAGPNVSANAPYFVQLEEEVPLVTVTGITVPVAGTITIATANTSFVKVGDEVVVASATGNTSVNGTWPISSIVANTSITCTGTSSTTGTVTGSPTARFRHTSSNLVGRSDLGDMQKTSATVVDCVGSVDWSTISAGAVTTGNTYNGLTAIMGSDPTGGKNCAIIGDSIVTEVRDGNTNSPSSTLTGDARGNLAFMQRALAASNYPAMRMSCPGMSDGFYNYGDDSLRKWLCNFADTIITQLGHNYVSTAGSYTGFKNRQINLFTRYRQALRGGQGRIVATTQTPTTTSIDLWHQRPTNQTFAANFGITNYIYTNYHLDLVNPAVFLTGAAGGIDAVLDIAQITSDLAGAHAIDGYWPVDGTDYKYTTDGTHPSKDGHIGIAAALNSSVLSAALGY